MTSEGDFKRPRSTREWRFAHFYEQMEDFVHEPLRDGLNTISINGRFLDFVIRNRGSKVTLVAFHGALSPRQKTLPFIEGEGIAEGADINLLSFSDPSLTLGKIDCAWFLGDRALGALTDRFRPIIDHMAAETNTEQIIFFGGSGGGYAAVNFASEYDGSTAVAMNPRLNLNAGPSAKLRPYLEICHEAHSATPMRRLQREFFTPNLAEKFKKETGPELLLVQNKNDVRYLNRQTIPFIKELSTYSQGYVLLFDGTRGHSPANREFLIPLISKLSSAPSQDTYLSLGFQKFSDFNEAEISRNKV